MSAVLDDNIGFDDPIDEANQTRSSDRNSVAIAQDIGRVQNALSEFDRVAAGLAAIEARYPKDAVYEVGTSKGLKDATEHRAAWRDPRITVEKARKMAKAPLLALGKSIDARAAWITAKLLEGEEPIDQLIKAEEARREQEKQDRINAEAGRILGIQEALAEIGQDVLIASSKASSDIQALLDKMNSEQPDPLVFQEMIDQARTAWAAGITKLETALKAKLWDEAEQRRVAAEQAAEAERRAQEAVRMEAQRLENERIAAEQRVQAERLAAERAEFERQKAELAAAQAEREEREAQERAAAKSRQTQEAEALAAQNSEAQAPEHVVKAEAATPDATAPGTPVNTSPSVGSMGAGQAADAAPTDGGIAVFKELADHYRATGQLPAETPAPAPRPTLTLGEIKERLGFVVTADFLQGLGFEAAIDRNARLYRESDWPGICAGISAHVLAAAKTTHAEAA